MHNHVIIGTAGHIDHGKTTLIRALTGRNTDRLQEEIRRGISIDLGFTYFDLPGNRRAGIIDVPGHERFIKNMIAGAVGIDILLLVVDTTEGVKPQTLEHADIASFLSVKEGLVVMTKYAEADDILRELAADDIREQLRGTFFADKDICQVDSLTGYGLDTLIEKINELTQMTRFRDDAAAPRLHIDRSFTMKGFGTVVTGTLLEGTVCVNDEMAIYTARTEDIYTVRIKNIQIHGENTQIAYAGQRTALNITGAKASSLLRGDVLAALGTVVRTPIMDARISLTSRSPVILKMWDRLRIYLGAREIFARFVPLEELGEVAPGGSAFCQLRFEQDVFIKKNDPFVVRRYSPMQTLGGGIVIDPAPPKRRRASVDILADLHTRMEGTPFETLDRCLRASGQVMDIKALATLAAIGEEQTMQTIKKLIDNKSVYPIGQGYLHGDILENYRSLLLEYLNQFHEKEPLLPGIPKEMLRTKAGLPLNAREYDTLLALLHAGGFCKTVENYVALTGFSPQFNDRQQQICDHILKTYLDAGFTPPSKTIFTQDKQSQAVFNALAKNKLLPLDEDTFLHINHMEAAKNMIRAHCVAHKTLTLAQFRDMAQSSRKYCLLILEYLDDRCFTKREGDNTRILYKGQ